MSENKLQGGKNLHVTPAEGGVGYLVPTTFALAQMSPLIYPDLIKALWSELRGDIVNACQVLTLIDPPLDSWHRLQDKLSGGWWGKRVTGSGCQVWLFIAG